MLILMLPCSKYILGSPIVQALAIVALSLFGLGGAVVGGMTLWRGVHR